MSRRIVRGRDLVPALGQNGAVPYDHRPERAALAPVHGLVRKRDGAQQMASDGVGHQGGSRTCAVHGGLKRRRRALPKTITTFRYSASTPKAPAPPSARPLAVVRSRYRPVSGRTPCGRRAEGG